VLGLAGVMPYLATSLSTVYCAWEINHAAATGSGLLMSERSAELLLHILEPLQIGYGAVVGNVTNTAIRKLTGSRSSPSSVRSTGASNGQAMAATTATHVMLLVSLHQPLHGLPSCFLSSMR